MIMNMEYKQQPRHIATLVKPRLIIHGGAGNITPEKLGPEKYEQYRRALLTIVRALVDFPRRRGRGD